MKLRNKKTGEIVSLEGELLFDEKIVLLKRYSSLAELNEEWEDYEESKETWYIDCDGEVYEPTRLNQFDLDRMSNIGNLFETKEEAEKAVEKLKAWKRLKDKGFRFKGINDDGSIKTGLSKGGSLNDCEEFYVDMELLFGGEE